MSLGRRTPEHLRLQTDTLSQRREREPLVTPILDGKINHSNQIFTNKYSESACFYLLTEKD